MPPPEFSPSPPRAVQPPTQSDWPALLQEALVEIGTLHPDLNVGRVRALDRSHEDVADSGQKAVVEALDTAAAVGLLVISSTVDPSSAARAAAIATQIRAVLGPDVGNVVLEPLAEGRVGGRSYVLWPWHHVLPQSRLLRVVRHLRLHPHVLRWLRDVAARTATPVPEALRERQYNSTLSDIVRDDSFPRAMRDAASFALHRLNDGRWQPHSTVEHNDFWVGNLLLPRDRAAAKRHARGFIVIDWEGARTVGYPVLDLVRFALSSRLPQALLRRESRAHGELLGCETEDLCGYVLAALGGMGQSLGHFPKQRYQELAVQAFESIRTTLSPR